MTQKTIQLKRNPGVLSGRSEAIEVLSGMSHVAGQPVSLNYRVGEDDVDTLLAIGLSEGIGPDHYRILASTSIRAIHGIIHGESELPDSSTLVTGHTYVYKKDTLSWIYLDNLQRIDSEVNPGVYYKLTNLSDGLEYWMYGGEIQRVTGSYSKEQTDVLLTELLEQTGSQVTVVTENLRELVRKLIISLGATDELSYPGTIPGASSYDEADSVLMGMITASTGDVSSLTTRVGNLEDELLSRDPARGLTGETRLDEVYQWYYGQTHKSQYAIEFSDLQPGTSLIAGTTHKFRASYSWSWAPETITGISLKTGSTVVGTKTLGEDGVPAGFVSKGATTIDFVWSIPEPPVGIETSGATNTWTGSFISDGITKTYSPVAVPVKYSIDISVPEIDWKPITEQAAVAEVVLTSTGIPGSWKTDDSWKPVIGGTPREISGGGLTAEVTLDPSEESVVTAEWLSKTSTVSFKPFYYTVLPTGTPVTLANISGSTSLNYRYLTNTTEIGIPATEYSSGNSLVIVCPELPKSYQIFVRSGSQNWESVSSDFSSPVAVEFKGMSGYKYIYFENIGAGNFEFVIRKD